jgi:hypothetical protein
MSRNSIVANGSSDFTTQNGQNDLALASYETQRAVHSRLKLNKVLNFPEASSEDEAATKAKTETIIKTPASSLTWAQVTELARTDPELAEQKLGALRLEAAEELRSGHRAARINQTVNATPLERARHLALSDEMRRQFQPRNGIEDVLLQNLVQAQSQYEHWLAIYVRHDSFGVKKPNDDAEPFETPRLTEAEAIEQAMDMVERWQKMLLRCLRALKEWRRQPIIVANQVNIAEQQIVSQSG